MAKIHVAKNICEYMNSMSPDREYSIYEVSVIRHSIRIEYCSRKTEQIEIAARSEEGKRIVNKMTAIIANNILKPFDKKITHEDIGLFKRCRIFEYENRKFGGGWEVEEYRHKIGIK